MKRGVAGALMLVCVIALTGSRAADGDLKRGDAAPAIDAVALDGAAVKSAEMRGSLLVLLFGEADHQRTLDAQQRIAGVLADPRFTPARPRWLMIVPRAAGEGPLPKTPGSAAASTVEPVTLVDAKREIFGAYHIVVLPSVFVIGGDGKVVHAITGLNHRFADVLADALTFAAGKMSEEEFDRRLHPDAAGPASEATLKAGRLMRLGQHLVQRGMDSMAEQKFREAVAADGDFAPAHLALGAFLLRHDRLDDAEREFRAVLERRSSDDDAALGVIEVQVRRGGAALDVAADALRPILVRRHDWPRARFVNGLLLEARGDQSAAAAEFKSAAEMLLRQAETSSTAESAPSPAPDS